MIRLEVIAPIPTTFRHCLHCEQLLDGPVGAQARLEMEMEYPVEFRAEFARLLEWIDGLTGRFGSTLQVRVVDPQSPEGLWKCLRYGVRHYPAFVVQGRRRVLGWDRAALEEALEEARVSG